MRKTGILLAVILSLALVMTGCSDMLGTNTSSGELALSIADVPVKAEHVRVTLDEVRAHNMDTGEWITINDFENESDGTVEVDLLNYRFAEKAIQEGKMIPEGTYNQIRLILAAKTEDEPGKLIGDSYVVYTDDSGAEQTENVFVPGGKFIINQQNSKNGFKGFKVEADGFTNIVLDFDVNGLMNMAGKPDGKIILEPTAIEVINNNVTESIVGEVTLDGSAVTDKDVTVELLQDGKTIKSTLACTGDKDKEGEAGDFKIRGVEKGTYTVKASVTIDNIQYEAESEVEITEEDLDNHKPKSIGELRLASTQN